MRMVIHRFYPAYLEVGWEVEELIWNVDPLEYLGKARDAAV